MLVSLVFITGATLLALAVNSLGPVLSWTVGMAGAVFLIAGIIMTIAGITWLDSH